MQTLPLCLISACLSIAAAPQDMPVHFVRTFKAGEETTCRFELTADKPVLDLVETISETVKKPSTDLTPATILLESTNHKSTGADAGSKPDALTALVRRHNMPDDITMIGGNYLFLLARLAGYTPDKDVAKGDTFVIEYGSEKGSVKVHGRAKVTSIDLAAMTISTHIATSINFGGQPLGKADFDSVSDLKTGALIRSKGTFGIPSLLYHIKIGPAA